MTRLSVRSVSVSFVRRAHLVRLALLPVLLAVGILLTATPVEAATIVVTSTGEDLIGNNGQCTLLEALNNANNDLLTHPDCLVAGSADDTVTFNIPAAQCPGGICTISTTFTYTIVQAVTIDGYTQPGASPNTLAVGNNAAIRVVLDGSNTVPVGLTIDAGPVTVRGLSIGRYTQHGIRFVDGSSSRVFGNFIGVAPDGTTARPNGLSGLRVEGTAVNTIIGSAQAADRNVISGNTGGSGISLDGAGGHGIWGNYIGVNAAGTTSLPNVNGIRVSTNAGTILIGGTCAGCGGNVISGNTGNGIRIDNDGRVRIQSNLVGTNAAGTASVPNQNGILVVDGSTITIGGRTAAERNIVSGNAQLGIFLGATQPGTGRVIEGNYIGAGVNGSNIGNGGTGVIVERDTTVGGTAPGAGNLIAFNGGPGVAVNVLNNAILGNTIFSNAGIGIDLGGNGVTPNDLPDGAGVNRSQNFPVLTRAAVGTQTSVAGTLTTRPNRNYRVEIFSSPACDPSGFGEGQTFVGSTDVTTDASGNAAFVAGFPPLPAGQVITATATELSVFDTSEFSACITLQQAGFTLTPVSGPTSEANEGGTSDASFTLRLNTLPTSDVTIQLSVSDSSEGAIVGPTTLTFTPANGTTAQTVLLVGVDDTLDDGDVAYQVILGSATSTDPAYAGLDPPDIVAVNRDDDDPPPPVPGACSPRPKVNLVVVRDGGGLRATVSITSNDGFTNELRLLTWGALNNAIVTVDGAGPVQAGQRIALPPGQRSVTFLVSRAPSAQTATAHLTVTDVCGDWPTFVGGGRDAF